MTLDQMPIREVLKELKPSVAHKASEQPDIRDIYTPPQHAGALDPNRILVVGGRGTGKSFWTSVLKHDASREVAADAYPKLGLNNIDVKLGFHEGALGSESATDNENIAPSPAVLQNALRTTSDTTQIWRSVLLKALDATIGPRMLRERVAWIENNPEQFEDALVTADTNRFERGKTLLLIFDALDLLANDWQTIRDLTRGLIRLAQEMSARRAIRMKIFMRRDQFEDTKRKTFVDFSKVATASVLLEWKPTDLYGALFTRLWNDQRSSNVIKSLCRNKGIAPSTKELPRTLKSDESKQQMLFSSFAGEFMGANEKRGRTYTWVPKHLADAHGETSLRSFLVALRTAASLAQDTQKLALDYRGINQGVLMASDTRREEIKEDHPWIEYALSALEGLTVPCTEREVIQRWKEAKSIKSIRERSDPQRPAAPIQLELADPDASEQALLKAMADLGIIEERGSSRVNVPDIFRVAAKMKRKGGVPPRRHR